MKRKTFFFFRGSVFTSEFLSSGWGDGNQVEWSKTRTMETPSAQVRLPLGNHMAFWVVAFLKYFLKFSPRKLGKKISHFDDRIFQMGWFKHQLACGSIKIVEGLGSDRFFFQNCWGKLPTWGFRESVFFWWRFFSGGGGKNKDSACLNFWWAFVKFNGWGGNRNTHTHTCCRLFWWCFWIWQLEVSWGKVHCFVTSSTFGTPHWNQLCTF